jgi:hypothetical protein
VAIGAATTDAAQIAVDTVRDLGGSPRARVLALAIARPWPTPRWSTAFSATYIRTILHPTGTARCGSTVTCPYTEAIAAAALRDGRVFSEHVTAATGTPENPMSGAELQEKFAELVPPVLRSGPVPRLVQLVNQLEALPDIGR